MKKRLVALGVSLAVAISANVAMAYVAVVGTAVPVTTAVIKDRERLDSILRSAIQDVLDRAIGFTPTVVTLQRATVVGDRLYILLFITDEDGQSTIEALSTDSGPESTPDAERPKGEHRPGGGEPPSRTMPSQSAPDLGPSF